VGNDVGRKNKNEREKDKERKMIKRKAKLRGKKALEKRGKRELNDGGNNCVRLKLLFQD